MLHLADRSITRPFGVVEDVLVKVHQLTFSVDFVIMDIEEYVQIPLILGWLFMLTSKCVVDIGNGNLEMRMEDQKVTFNLFEAIEHPNHSKTCFKVEEIEQKATLVGEHLNFVFVEEDEVKPVVNLADYSTVLLGPKQVTNQATPALPPAVPLPDVSPPPTGQTSLPFSQSEQLLPMLHSLHHDQRYSYPGCLVGSPTSFY